jgi:hypothetical protein
MSMKTVHQKERNVRERRGRQKQSVNWSPELSRWESAALRGRQVGLFQSPVDSFIESLVVVGWRSPY